MTKSKLSGEIIFDHILKNQRYGFVFKTPLLGSGCLRIQPSLLMGKMTSTYSFGERFTLWEEEGFEEYEFESEAYFLEPGINLSLVLKDAFVVGIYSGVPYFIKSDPYSMGNSHLYSPGQKYVRPDWLEIKFMMRLGFLLK